MKRGIVFIFLIILLLSPVMALDSLGTFKQSDCINISQTCASCSYINISSISNQQNSSLVSNVGMVYFGNGEWRYGFCYTDFIGRYDVRGKGDINSVPTSFATYFEITPSGRSGEENIWFFVISLGLLYFLTLFFLSKRDIEFAPFVILSGMALGFFGVYMINQGVIIFRDQFTNYLSYITIGIGFGLSLYSAIAWIKESI